MAARKRKAKAAPKYTQVASAWYRDVTKLAQKFSAAGDYDSAAIIEAQRAAQEKRLKKYAKLVRKYADGFDPKDGYALSKVAFWPMDRVRRIEEYGARLEKEESQTRKTIRPRTKGAIEAVRKHTGQRGFPTRKAFNVIVQRPEATAVKIVKSTRTERGKKKVEYHVEEIDKTKRGKVFKRFFYLPEGLNTFEEIEAATKKMLPRMPKGYYVLISSVYGGIATPIEKYNILRVLPEYFFGYDAKPGDSGLASTIIGYQLVGYQLDEAKREYVERLTWRETMRRERAKQKARAGAKRLKRYGRT